MPRNISVSPTRRSSGHTTGSTFKRALGSSRFARPILRIGLAFVVLLSIRSTLNAQTSVSLSEIRRWESAGEHERIVERLDLAIEAEPTEQPAYYYWRGRALFCLAEVERSVADFDRYIELTPSAASRQWERGIALFYAERYREGAEQFELYQTYHDNDVENSAWRFLCEAKAASVAEAEENLLPIRNDPRVPMMEIYRMFGGELSPQAVIERAEESSGNETADRRQRFYANLYVGLFFEINGETEKALECLRLAQELKIDHFMWNVADVHLKRLASE